MTNTFYFLLFFLLFGSQAQEPSWDKVSESDGILTKIGSDPQTGFPIFESTVTINSDKQSVFKQLTDYDNLKNLLYSVSESKKLSDKDDGAVAFYYFDMPWPVSNKYTTTEEYWTISENQIDIRIESTESDYQPDDDITKIEYIKTNWTLSATDDNTTKVTYRSTGDPMGIPNWVVKMFLSASPKETLTNLKAKCEGSD
ncbi:MAG: SRPBCC family protein [Bacteroidota bacterium]